MVKELNIIGIYVGHNSGAALTQGGVLTRAISEEKFNNKKNFIGFPHESIKWCASFVEKIDYIAIAGETPILPGMKNYKNRRSIIKNLKSLANFFPSQIHTKTQKLLINLNTSNTRKEFFKNLNDYVSKDNIYFLDHHLCHASAAYFGMAESLNEEYLVLTLDGYGDFTCATVNIAKNGILKEISRTPMEHSLGSIYGKTTEFLGMKENEHEYKVMGLAPYAKQYFMNTYEKVFSQIFDIDENDLTFKSKFNTQLFENYLRKKAVGERFDNLAAALQYFSEETVLKWVNLSIKKTNIQNVITSGGVFMNVKINKRISEMNNVKKCLFLPSCGDETLPFGAAYYLFKKISKVNCSPFKNIYLGMNYTNTEVEKFLVDNNYFKIYNINRFENIERKIAELLSNNNVVARVKSSCEFGARSLGNRSILANPSNMESFFKVNDQIKVRDFWMPFAPSILYEFQHKYIKNNKSIDAEYMILGFDTHPLAYDHLKAAMHQGDKTVRPQLVKKSKNPSYHQLISYFHEITGIAAVMNTSLNIHGYPLAGTLEQALFTFNKSGLRYIAIENFLIEKF